jgi:hypothetical protein
MHNCFIADQVASQATYTGTACGMAETISLQLLKVPLSSTSDVKSETHDVSIRLTTDIAVAATGQGGQVGARARCAVL